MKDRILEICVDSLESAIAAEKGGADRLELCQNLVIGGTTPGPKLLEAVKRQIHLPVHVLIRPRFGDFCYTGYELEQMKEEVRMFRELGADGIVIGILSPDGTLDRIRMEKLGIQTILTSGRQTSCQKGMDLLAKIQRESQDKICIMAGGGVTPENIEELYQRTKIKVYHMSAKIEIESEMKYRNPDVRMGIADISEYRMFRTSQKKVRQAAEILKHL